MAALLVFFFPGHLEKRYELRCDSSPKALTPALSQKGEGANQSNGPSRPINSLRTSFTGGLPALMKRS